MTDYQLGIDVSHHQDPTKIDYRSLRAEGYSWVIARASYGTEPDKTFVEHCKRASDAGMLVGGYLFLRGPQDAIEQLDVFQAQLSKVDFQIAPVLDLEVNSKYDGPLQKVSFVSKSQLILQALRVHYGEAIAYLAPGFYQQLGSPSWLKEYPWWVAHYTSEAKPWCPWVEWSMWQHTGNGQTSGFKGDLDLNRAVKLPLRTDLLPSTVPPPSQQPSDLAQARAKVHRGIAAQHEELARLHKEMADAELKGGK